MIKAVEQAGPDDVLVVCASHSPGMDRDAERVQGRAFREGLARARTAIADFDPQLVVLIGGDHRRAFRHITPPFSIVASATTIDEGERLPKRRLPVATEIAHAAVSQLLDADIDVALCRDVELDHAFSQPLRDLVGDRDDLPVLPVPVNCASPPLPRPQRVLTFARALRSVLSGSGRVLAIGTGGLSHSPPSLETDRHDLDEDERRRIIADGLDAARDRIRPDWDRQVLGLLATGDLEGLARMLETATEDAGVGANEVRTWLAASTLGDGPLATVTYEPVREWITGMGIAVSSHVTA